MRRHRPHLVGLGLAAALFVPDLVAQETTDAEKLQNLQRQFTEASSNWSSKYQAASKKERSRLVQNRPLARDWFERVFAIAKAAPQADTALDASLWILANHAAVGTDVDRVVGVLSNHVKSEKLARACALLARVPSTAVANFLRQLEENSPHTKVKGMACFYRAALLKNNARMVRTLQTADEKRTKLFAEFYGRENIDVLKNTDAEELEKTAEMLFVRVQENKDYSGLKHRRDSLGKAAKINLFEMRNLGIGKTAPDIIGEDIDANPMKLTDYRGKVVVIDFWGDW